ncbi:MAG TPA: DUF2834 domain-containing protein [Thermomicrobiales bacterium]|jgi:hypothetical protein
MRTFEPIAPTIQPCDSSGRIGGSRRRQAVYAGLLLLGIVLPFSRFGPWLSEHGVDLPRFGEELFANRISSFFGWDVLTPVATLLALAFADHELRPAQRWLVATGSLLGASVGLPLYLLLREGNRCRIAQ